MNRAMANHNEPARDVLYTPIEHEKRSREVADSLRRLLVGLNTGGVAVLLTAASKLMDDPWEKSPIWAAPPLGFFVLSLVLICLSLWSAKRRELRRRDRAIALGVKDGSPVQGEVRPAFEHSTLWDSAAAALFVFGFCWAVLTIPV